jgi:chromosome segregation ATPase
VTNQLAHRGNVQPNLLKAAARQNAEAIAKLVAERAALVTTQNSLSSQITAAEKEIAALDAAYATLVGQIDTVTMSLTKLESDKATLTAAITAAETELMKLQGQSTTLVNQITPLQTQLTAAESELAGSQDRRRPLAVTACDQGGRAGRRADPPGRRDRGGDHRAERVNAQVAAIETATQELAGLVAQGMRLRRWSTPPSRSWRTPASRCRRWRPRPRRPTPTPPPRPLRS